MLGSACGSATVEDTIPGLVTGEVGGSNGPWRGGLSTAYEGGMRTPAMVRWPGKIKPGTVINDLMSHGDWMPTLMAAANGGKDTNIQERLKKGGVEAAGKTYYEFRAELMVRQDEGLTKTYNRFHDPDETNPRILKLRELHAAMDRAAYARRNADDEARKLLDAATKRRDTVRSWRNKKHQKSGKKLAK